jgi:hypothetical protein
LDAAWVDDVLVGICEACDRIDVRCNPTTLMTERVLGDDPLSQGPREVVIE